MLIKSLFIFILLVSHSYAFINLEPIIAFGFGNQIQKDSVSSDDQSYIHSGTVLSIEGGIRGGLDFEKVGFGAVAIYGKSHSDTVRHDVDGINSIFSANNAYDSIVEQKYSGGYLTITPNSSFGLIFEYYPHVYQHVIWTEDISKNIRVAADHMLGIGGAVGVMFKSKEASVYIMYRKVEYRSGSLESEKVEDFDDSGYSNPFAETLLFQLGVHLF